MRDFVQLPTVMNIHRVYNFLESYWERRIHESVINICERARCE